MRKDAKYLMKFATLIILLVGFIIVDVNVLAGSLTDTTLPQGIFTTNVSTINNITNVNNLITQNITINNTYLYNDTNLVAQINELNLTKVSTSSHVKTFNSPLFINTFGNNDAVIDGGFNLSISQVNSTQGGFLSATDYNSFNARMYGLTSYSNYLLANNQTIINFNETLLNTTIKSICIQNNTPANLTNVVITGNLSVKRPYAMFSNNYTQTVPIIATPYFINFSTVEDNYLINIVNQQNITVTQTGDYLFILSAEVISSSPNSHIEIWARKNGVNIPRSNSKYEFKSSNAETVLTIPFIIDVTPNDNIQFMYAGDNTGIQMLYVTNTSYSPEVPSIILTVTKLSEVTE